MQTGWLAWGPFPRFLETARQDLAARGLLSVLSQNERSLVRTGGPREASLQQKEAREEIRQKWQMFPSASVLGTVRGLSSIRLPETLAINSRKASRNVEGTQNLDDFWGMNTCHICPEEVTQQPQVSHTALTRPSRITFWAVSLSKKMSVSLL